MVTVSSMAFNNLDSTFGAVQGRYTVLGELNCLLQDPHKFLSLVVKHRGRSQDWQPGTVSTLVLCGRGDVCSGGQIAVCWHKAMPLLGKHTGSAVWGLCWKRLAPVRSSASLPPLSTLENWLPLGTCLQLWRLLRAGAPFQRTGIFLFVLLFIDLVFFFFFSLFYILPVNIALVMSLTRSFQSWTYPVYELSPWAGSGMTAWGKRTLQPVLWDTGRVTFSILDSCCWKNRDWYKLLTRGVVKRFIFWLQSR